jgi:PAS domain-containing protein
VKDQTIPRVLALFALICVVLIALAVHAVRNVSRAAAATDWVNATHATVNELSSLGASLQAGEGCLRLFAQSADPRDQAACRQAYADTADHLEVLKALTRSDEVRHPRVLRLETQALARAGFARQVLKTKVAGQHGEVLAMLAADTGTAELSEVMREIAKLKTEYLDQLAERDRAAYLQAQTTRWTVWTGVGLNFALLAGAAWIMYRDISFRRQAAAALEQANAQLEVRVKARTAELSAANDQLALENLERRWANQALEHQLRYDRLIIDSISDLVLVVTKAGNISRINPAVSHVTGWDGPALINRPLTELVRPAPAADGRAPLVTDPIGRAMQDGRDLRDLPVLLRDRQGGDHAVFFTLYPLRDANKVVGGVATLRPAAPTTNT